MAWKATQLMPPTEFEHLELLAEVDALSQRLGRLADQAPAWQPTEACRALLRRLLERSGTLRVRLQCPLVVATLGGTGTGKSALVNALLGAEVVTAGRARPTTLRPTLIARSDISPEMLGIEPDSVEVVHRDLPLLNDLVLIDCPDPDTTEDSRSPGTNLARLRPILPHCDVLLVTSTQQKYRSARVSEELAAAAPGARLVFVQTHADTDADIRDDWRKVLSGQYVAGEIFWVDSLRGLDDALAGRPPQGELARLADLLMRQLAGTAGNRIRRANFLDLVSDTLGRAVQKLDAAMPPVDQLDAAIAQQRAALGAKLVRETQAELLANRRVWEVRLLGRIASRWGFSPFALVLRALQGVGGLAAQALLFRLRTPAQIALWGALEGARRLRARDQQTQATQAVADAAGCWDQADLHAAALVVAGYAVDAGFDRQLASRETIETEAGKAGRSFADTVAAELERVLDRLAERHTGWFTRMRYEALLLAMLGVLLYRLGKNFFYDSWWLAPPLPVFGVEFYVASAFWLVLWCLVLFWAFTRRLRRGLQQEIGRVAGGWSGPQPAAGLFGHLDEATRRGRLFRQDLDLVRQQVEELRRRLALPEDQLGHKR